MKPKHARTVSAKWLEKYERWQINVTNEAGVRKSFYCSTPGRAGQRECNAKADEWLRSDLKSTAVRMDAALTAWLSELEQDTRTVSVTGKAEHDSHYKQLASVVKNHVLPVIGNIKVSKLDLDDLQQVIQVAYRKGLAKKSLQNIRGALSLFLTWARRKRLTDLTSADLVIPNRAPVGERTILSPNDIGLLFTSDVTGEWYVNAWRLQVLLGFRPGELIALERRHDIGEKLLVRGAINSSGVRTSGKNDNAIRDVVLPPIARQILDDQKKKLADAGVISKYLFPAPDGSATAQRNVYRHWKSFTAANGITPCTLYELRHTFVSVCSGMSNISLGDLKSLVGHSRNMDTLGIYGHKLSDADLRISSEISAAFGQLIGE